MKFSPPFSQKTFEHFISGFAKAVNTNECCSIINLAKRDQLYRIKQIQDNPGALRKFIKNFDATLFLFLDIVAENIEDKVDLKSYLAKNRKNQDQKTVIFILDADKMLDERKHLLSLFDNLYHQNNKLCLIYLFQKNITLPRYTCLFSSLSTLYQNIYIFSLFEKDDMRFYIHGQLYERFGVRVPKKTAEEIIQICGGQMWLIKQAVRYYSQTKDKKHLFDNEGMRLRLEILYDELLSEEKQVLEKIAKKDKFFSDEEKKVLDYFLKTKLVKKQNSHYFITIPIFARFILEKSAKKTQISLNGQNQIIINGLNADHFFSFRERRFVKFLIKKTNQLISRNQAAEAFWGQKNSENYTDWALDQAIRRLRKKFIQMGFNPKIIKTIKNQGFIFEPNYASN